MKCPYCGKEMVEGAVDSRSPIYFTERPRKILNLPRKQDVKLTQREGEKEHFLPPTYCTAFHCENCRKVIVQYQ